MNLVARPHRSASESAVSSEKYMDNKNRFHTSGTWFLVRAEHITLMIVLSVLIAMHAAVVNWGRFIFAFVIIDLIGYLPGAIAYRRARGGPIAPIYHHLYNFAHSYLTAAVWLDYGHLPLAPLSGPCCRSRFTIRVIVVFLATHISRHRYRSSRWHLQIRLESLAPPTWENHCERGNSIHSRGREQP